MAELKLTQQMFDRAKANKCVGWFYMDPRDYLRLTIDEANVDAWIAHEGDEVQSLEVYNSYNITLMPWLDVDMHSGKVVGHEGRHRAAACIKAGVKKFPVAICLREQGYPTYYRQPFIDEYENPKQLMKVFVTKDDVPSMLKGQFRAASVSIKSNIAHMQEFWAQENRVTAQLHKGKTMATKELTALARLEATAAQGFMALQNAVVANASQLFKAETTIKKYFESHNKADLRSASSLLGSYLTGLEKTAKQSLKEVFDASDVTSDSEEGLTDVRGSLSLNNGNFRVELEFSLESDSTSWVYFTVNKSTAKLKLTDLSSFKSFVGKNFDLAEKSANASGTDTDADKVKRFTTFFMSCGLENDIAASVAATAVKLSKKSGDSSSGLVKAPLSKTDYLNVRRTLTKKVGTPEAFGYEWEYNIFEWKLKGSKFVYLRERTRNLVGTPDTVFWITVSTKRLYTNSKSRTDQVKPT